MGKRVYQLNTIMSFGKHMGMMIEDLIEDFPDYIQWLYDKNIVTFGLEVTKKLEDKKII